MNSNPNYNTENKNELLGSFLETSPITLDQWILQDPISRRIQQIQDLDDCYICNKPFDKKQKKRRCYFCKQNICHDHLRKQRKIKSGAFQKICDNCEDYFLFSKLIQYEFTADEQAIARRQQSARNKYQSILDQYEAKIIKHQSLQQKYEQINQRLQNKMNEYYEVQETISREQQEILEQHDLFDQAEVQLNEIQASIQSRVVTDYQTMQQQNQKLTKQLNKIQKKCQEVKFAIQKREKEIEVEYFQWQAKQKKRIQKKKNEKCSIF